MPHAELSTSCRMNPLRLQVLPPIGTSSGRGRVHNRPQARVVDLGMNPSS